MINTQSDKGYCRVLFLLGSHKHVSMCLRFCSRASCSWPWTCAVDHVMVSRKNVSWRCQICCRHGLYIDRRSKWIAQKRLKSELKIGTSVQQERGGVFAGEQTLCCCTLVQLLLNVLLSDPALWGNIVSFQTSCLGARALLSSLRYAKPWSYNFWNHLYLYETLTGAPSQVFIFFKSSPNPTTSSHIVLKSSKRWQTESWDCRLQVWCSLL